MLTPCSFAEFGRKKIDQYDLLSIQSKNNNVNSCHSCKQKKYDMVQGDVQFSQNQTQEYNKLFLGSFLLVFLSDFIIVTCFQRILFKPYSFCKYLINRLKDNHFCLVSTVHIHPIPLCLLILSSLPVTQGSQRSLTTATSLLYTTLPLTLSQIPSSRYEETTGAFSTSFSKEIDFNSTSVTNYNKSVSGSHEVTQRLIFKKVSWATVCPTPCSCSTQISSISKIPLKTLDCRNVGMTKLPSNISRITEAVYLSGNRLLACELSGLSELTNMTELVLSGNHMYSLDDWNMDNENMLYLAIERNELDFLSNRSFVGMPNLLYISVASNKMELLHDDAFYGLERLRTLVLSFNRLFAINPLWFRDLLSLQLLDLTDNNIHILRDWDFQFLTSLSTLKLSNNKIKHIYNEAFRGLERLKYLYVDGNHLIKIPTTPCEVFHDLGMLDLSRNHIERLEEGSVSNLNVSHLWLNHMKWLTLVEQYAFTNLKSLIEVHLANNPSLQYVDSNAFAAVPSLRRLVLSGSNLSAIQEDIISTFPSIRSIDMSNCPFVCDCNVFWLVQELHWQTMNISFGTNSSLKCSSPLKLRGTPLYKLTMKDIPEECSPRVLPLFVMEYNTVLGERMRMDCRALGVPRPQIDWLLPDHTAEFLNDYVTVLKSGTSQNVKDHLVLDPQGTLFIDYIQGSDHGQYTCIASNPQGRDERTVHVHVKNMRANVIILGVTATSITVTWRSTKYTHDYQISYRESTGNVTSTIIDIKPYMRTYTASHLKPKTLYEFCIAVKHDGKSMKINCTHLLTRNKDFMSDNVFKTRNTVIATSLVCFSVILIIFCMGTYFVRRYNKKRRMQEELYGDNLSQLFLASMDSMSDTTPITYENRAAEIFDDDDIEEIRSAAAAAKVSATTVIK